MKQEILKERTQTLYMTPYINNRPAIASSATITVTKPGGEVIVIGATATVDATTGEISYSLSSANNTLLGENFQAQWTYVVSSVTYYHTSLFDVVLNKLGIAVIDADISDEQSDLLERNESVAGAVDSATSTTIVDADLKQYVNDYWNGGKVKVTNPATGLQQVRNITDFVQSTGTVTADSAFATTPDSTYTYEVTRGFANKISAAFDEVMIDVRARGYRPALIMESSDLRIPTIKKALAMICRDFAVSPDDKWFNLAVEYDKQYKDVFSKITFQYDASESGYIGSDFEKDRDMGSVRLKR